jgi:tetrahydromethanopterin S-methyltransferase subunit B
MMNNSKKNKAAPTYVKGDNVRIVAGNYKKNGYGVYLGTYGTVMCQVQVKGDTRPHRNIWLTSIKPIPKTEARKANVNETDAPKEQEKAKSAGRWEKEDYMNYHEREQLFVKVAKTEMAKLLSDLNDMQEKMKEMSDKIDACLEKKDYE